MALQQKFFVLLLLTSWAFSSGQNSENSADEIFNGLFELYQATNNLDEQKFAANKIIEIGKSTNSLEKLVVGYQLASELYEDKTQIVYCDSIIAATAKQSIKLYPSSAYFTKASFYQNEGNFAEAIDNYLKARHYASIHNDESLLIAINASIGSLKRRVGDFEEALALYRSNLPLAKKYSKELNDHDDYLNTLASIANAHYELNNVDSATYYNKEGISKALKFNDKYYLHHFSTNEGIVHFLKGNYETAIDSLEIHRNYFEDKKDNINLFYLYHFLGESYLKEGNQLSALSYFNKVDSLFQLEVYTTPIVRTTYQRLIDHHKSKNDLENQLNSINALMRFDSINNQYERYLNKTIYKEYDIPKLQLEKAQITTNLKRKERRFLSTLVVLLTLLPLVIAFAIIQYKRKRNYKKQFTEFLNHKKQNKIAVSKVQIADKVVSRVLSDLDKFETNKGYISRNLTLNSLAAALNSNSSYLSKIINEHKNDSFSNYINELRVNYIIEELRSKPLIRKYTIKAISEMAGFNNSESFSKAFQKYSKVKPSFFIRSLEEKMKI